MDHTTTAAAGEPLAIAHAHGGHRQSYLSKALRFIGRVGDYCRELGTFTGLRWYAAKILSRLPVPGPKRLVVRPPDLLHPITVRMYPSSDDFVFDQLFVR